MKQVVFHTGGPSFHPVAEQARHIAEWLGTGFACVQHDGAEAFEHLDDCDLLVLMGLHWTGQKAEYRPMAERHTQALERYVASGRPLLAHHGAIASYDDWPRFGELAGFAWVWGTTNHSPVGDYRVQVLPTGHPVVAGMDHYTLCDELYYDIKMAAGMKVQVHAEAEWQGRKLPMVLTAAGGRVPGAGRAVYLANGHDLRAFECPALKQLWVNAVKWLM